MPTNTKRNHNNEQIEFTLQTGRARGGMALAPLLIAYFGRRCLYLLLSIILLHIFSISACFSAENKKFPEKRPKASERKDERRATCYEPSPGWKVNICWPLCEQTFHPYLYNGGWSQL